MKTRKIKTNIWNDDYFAGLKASEKVLYLYLMSNAHTELLPIYQCTDRVMAFETGLSPKDIQDAKTKFQTDGKFFFKDGYVLLTKETNHDSNESQRFDNAKKEYLSSLPEAIQSFYLHGIDTVSHTVSDTVSNTVSDTVCDTVSVNVNVNDNKEKGVVKGKRNRIEEITNEDIGEIAAHYGVPIRYVKSRLDDMTNWCQAKGKTYKDYKAALRNWVKKDAAGQSSIPPRPTPIVDTEFVSNTGAVVRIVNQHELDNWERLYGGVKR